MKRVAIGILVLTQVLLASLALAGDWGISASSQWRSEYLGSSGFVCHKGPVVQNDLFIRMPYGFSVDIWHSVGLDDKDLSSNGGDEIDLTVQWAGKMKFLPWPEAQKIRWSFGAAYFVLPEFEKIGGDFYEVYFVAERGFQANEQHTITPYIKVEAMFPSSGKSSLIGTYSHFGVKHLWKITSWLSLNHELSLMYDSGVCRADNGLLGKYSIGLNLRVYKAVSLDLGPLKVSFPIAGAGDRKPEVAYGAGVNLTF